MHGVPWSLTPVHRTKQMDSQLFDDDRPFGDLYGIGADSAVSWKVAEPRKKAVNHDFEEDGVIGTVGEGLIVNGKEA